MRNNEQIDQAGDLGQAFRRGRSEGLALAALVLGAAAFLNLLGAEKGLLAVVLGVLSLRGSDSVKTLWRGRIAILLGGLQLCTVLVVLVIFHTELAELVNLLKSLA